MFRYVLGILAAIGIVTSLYGKQLHYEKDYQKAWCKDDVGIVEYVLPNKTRVDCLTDEYAIEFDFAKKVYEAIGQSLYYGIMTDRKPAIAIIVEDEDKDQRYLDILDTVLEHHDIKVFKVTSFILERS
jgi:hypothetical protein